MFKWCYINFNDIHVGRDRKWVWWYSIQDVISRMVPPMWVWHDRKWARTTNPNVFLWGLPVVWAWSEVGVVVQFTRGGESNGTTHVGVA